MGAGTTRQVPGGASLAIGLLGEQLLCHCVSALESALQPSLQVRVGVAPVAPDSLRESLHQSLR